VQGEGDLLEVILALHAPGGLAGALNGGQQQDSQNTSAREKADADDGQHHDHNRRGRTAGAEGIRHRDRNQLAARAAGARLAQILLGTFVVAPQYGQVNSLGMGMPPER